MAHRHYPFALATKCYIYKFWCSLEWTKRGIVGRGVLIDYYSYALDKGFDYDPWSFTKISVSTIEEIARIEGVSFLAGDILFLRTGEPKDFLALLTQYRAKTELCVGFLSRYETMPRDALVQLMGQPEYHYPGLESSVESLEWLWNNHFAAVAGDNPAFEAWSVYYPNHLFLF